MFKSALQEFDRDTSSWETAFCGLFSRSETLQCLKFLGYTSRANFRLVSLLLVRYGDSSEDFKVKTLSISAQMSFKNSQNMEQSISRERNIYPNDTTKGCVNEPTSANMTLGMTSDGLGI